MTDEKTITITPEWVEDNAQWSEYRKTALAEAMRMEQPFVVETLEGTMRGKAGDYLMRGVHGELYPCDGKVFSETYELFSRAQDRRRAAQIAQIDAMRAVALDESNAAYAAALDKADEEADARIIPSVYIGSGGTVIPGGSVDTLQFIREEKDD